MNGLPEGTVAAKLRELADGLDALDRLAGGLLEPLGRTRTGDAGAVEATVQVTLADQPLTAEEIDSLLGWVRGDQMQDRLRRWADQLDRNLESQSHTVGQAPGQDVSEIPAGVPTGGSLAGSVVVGAGRHRSSDIPWIAVYSGDGRICFLHRVDLSVELGVVVPEELGRRWDGTPWGIEELASGVIDSFVDSFDAIADELNAHPSGFWEEGT